MNYRHAYHAGNFADVVKHAALALVVEHLKLKPQAFRAIDTHAGIGLYDLTGTEAQKTGEWLGGIGRVLGDAAMPADAAAALAPYLGVVRELNPEGRLDRYPGSPLLMRRLMRPGDQLVANELHAEDVEALRELFSKDRQAKILQIDAWAALKSLLPPKERRGVVLVDPPFEEPGELERMAQGLDEAVRRFATGTFLLWYPIKDPRAIAAFHRRLVASGHAKALVIELMIRGGGDVALLNGAGLVVLNPPYTLQDRMACIMKYLLGKLAIAPGASWRVVPIESACVAATKSRAKTSHY